MGAVQLADGVWRIPTAPADLVNSLLLQREDGGLVLVDAGFSRTQGRVLAALAQLRRAPQDVVAVVLTHAHGDHAGGLAALADATGGQVCSSERDAGHLREGRPPRSDPSTRLGRLLERLPGRGWAPTDVARTFSDGDLVHGLRVVATPGHTPGHCSFVHEATGTLITGDALVNVRGLRYAPSGFATDHRLARATAARLGELDFATAAFTHGAHVSTGARAAVRAFLAGRTS